MGPEPLLCPACGRPTRWDEAPRGPFCSERCRTLDLACWADGTYRIAGDDAAAAVDREPQPDLDG